MKLRTILTGLLLALALSALFESVRPQQKPLLVTASVHKAGLQVCLPLTPPPPPQPIVPKGRGSNGRGMGSDLV